MKLKLYILSLIVALGVGAGLGYLYFYYFSQKTDIQLLRAGQEKGQLINPLIACDVTSSQPSSKLESLKETLKNLVDEKIKNNIAKRISIYYRDLNSGSWTGVNEDDKYIPASLIKVPLLMAYYKKAETDPEILNKKITNNLEFDEDSVQEVAKPPTPLEKGKEYSASDLLFRMIAYSGNNSHKLLSQLLNPNYEEQIYKDLNVQYPNVFDPPTTEITSAKTFATFFRVLYNANYLSNKTSEQALELLTKTIFKEGLVSGVPKDIEVAHKFGERTIHYNETGEVVFRELHDCGIVYKTDKPYALCVMTQGMDFENLKKVIGEVSAKTYDFVNPKPQ